MTLNIKMEIYSMFFLKICVLLICTCNLIVIHLDIFNGFVSKLEIGGFVPRDLGLWILSKERWCIDMGWDLTINLPKKIWVIVCNFKHNVFSIKIRKMMDFIYSPLTTPFNILKTKWNSAVNHLTPTPATKRYISCHHLPALLSAKQSSVIPSRPSSWIRTKIIKQ